MWFSYNFEYSTLNEQRDAFQEVLSLLKAIVGKKERLKLTFTDRDLRRYEYKICLDKIYEGENYVYLINNDLIYVDFGDGEDVMPLDEVSDAALEAIRLKLKDMTIHENKNSKNINTIMNKKALYESIMNKVAKKVKKALNESVVENRAIAVLNFKTQLVDIIRYVEVDEEADCEDVLCEAGYDLDSIQWMCLKDDENMINYINL